MLPDRQSSRRPSSCGQTRRTFLADTGLGFTGLVLGAMLHQDGVARADSTAPLGDREVAPAGRPHFQPRAKSVIWILLAGGCSHLESFDPKPELNKHDGKTIKTTPYSAIADSTIGNHIIGSRGDKPEYVNGKLMRMHVGFQRYGRCGLEVSDWWPHVGSCADDIAVVRSMWSNDNDHGGQIGCFTGRHIRDGIQPTIGAWISYGLGSLNRNLPEYVVLGSVESLTENMQSGAYLGSERAGVPLAIGPGTRDAMPFITPAAGRGSEKQEAGLSLLGKLHRRAGIDYPDDLALRARIRSYELAYSMQTAIPELLQVEKESEATRKLYGIAPGETPYWGKVLLTARRLVERGVRFVQVLHGYNNGAGAWDSHGSMNEHRPLCQAVDRPIAGLLKDLKQRGLLDETIVVWSTEFGRTPVRDAGINGGRNHHPYGYSMWLAGGGIRGGVVHGATDELGFYAVENRHYITDIHATVLHQLGLDSHQLEVPGHKRLEMDFGKPIREIIA